MYSLENGLLRVLSSYSNIPHVYQVEVTLLPCLFLTTLGTLEELCNC